MTGQTSDDDLTLRKTADRLDPVQRRSGFSFPLKPAVLLIVMALTVPVLLAIIEINYRSTDRVVRDHATALVERFRRATVEDIVSEFDILTGQIAVAAELGRQEPGFFAEDRALGYLFRVLQHSRTVLNVYVGLSDGSFRQARRIGDPSQPILGAVPPPGTEYAYRLLDPGADGPLRDRYIFLDKAQTVLGEVAEPSQYDPRNRAWYREAVAAGRTMMTDPELFWALGLVGFSVAAPFGPEAAPDGVVAVDVTLDRFSDYLADHPLSPGSVSYLLDESGNVLAASDGAAIYGSSNQAVHLRHVADVGNRLVAMAYASRPLGGAETVYPFAQAGEDYIVGLSDFGEAFGKPWRLLVVTPLSDFTAALSRHNRQMVVFGLCAVAVQLLVIYLIASRVASPLRGLAAKVERIRSLQPADDLPVVRSPIREIAALSHAIETLDIAVQAFARFVPVGLVRQLLTSDQRLEIGGQSKFLTIFFSDMEGFSTLAERMASRELLDRISTMLELVSKCVHQEQGTIDKFVGDGVMAFWGAPAPLEDHAWHACVAALRVQRVLDQLNQSWRDADAPQMRLRVGIHSDAVLVGNVGSRERMSYTVLGDGVNIAARLETLNKDYGTLICISQDTFREAGDRLCVRPVDEVSLKGRRALTTVYELLGVCGAEPELAPGAEDIELARVTRRAFDALTAGDRDAALARYREVLALRPEDPVARVQIARLLAGHGQTDRQTDGANITEIADDEY
ncbi:adenylate/guanylate cyclase domain-containing protein [Pseudodonghicola xiamenensis]|uniref:Adenylate/guanylate cyclase domain-containing protein n=1 Tax=Pseudodonghicola xiamenensis TaxID=337702 RepID=A0A8J3H2E6_9RHOB|nr:adenylate/guanylate cyclase domain-containing protein [Pseudodonghicola xiamenensis]GHG79511.1 adenylate/guanylate cyclase domain-containing protein [Pseudodonghicola xiamenensis]